MEGFLNACMCQINEGTMLALHRRLGNSSNIFKCSYGCLYFQSTDAKGSVDVCMCWSNDKSILALKRGLGDCSHSVQFNYGSL